MATGSASNTPRKVDAEIMDLDGDFLDEMAMTREKRLGRGLSGEVILASFKDDPHDKRAVKIFPLVESKSVLFLREVAILKKISHPNILTNTMAFRCPDTFVLVMPYYPNGSLTQHLPRMPEDSVMPYFLQLTSAIVYLHSQDIAHRDVKPDNLLVGQDDDLLLIDFGLACLAESGNARMKKAGSKGYIPPEVFTGLEFDLFKCDLYAVGVVLWNLVFKGKSPANTNYLRFVDENKQMPSVYRSILNQLLTPDPCARWDGQQLVNALLSFPESSKMAACLLGPRP